MMMYLYSGYDKENDRCYDKRGTLVIFWDKAEKRFVTKEKTVRKYWRNKSHRGWIHLGKTRWEWEA